MKIRKGFVSNSSSSSFVVVFDRPELDVEYLMEILFDNQESIPYLYDWDDTCASFTTQELCQRIISNLTLVKDIEPIVDVFNGDYTLPWPKYNADTTIEERQLAYADYEQKCNKIAIDRANKFQEQHNCGYIFTGSFGDDNGKLESQLEHGDTFHNVPHQRISNH